MNLANYTRVLAVGVLTIAAVSCSRPASYYLEEGNRAYEAKKYDEAILDYRKAIQQDAQLGEAHYRLGLAQIKTGKLQDAYGSLQRAMPMLPQNEDVRVKVADILITGYLNDPQRPQGLYNQVSALANEVERINPQSADIYRLRGQLAFSDARYDEAIELFRRANSIRPIDRDIVDPMVRALIRAGQTEEAEKVGLELISKKKDADSIYDILYLLYLGQNRVADAENILKTKVSNIPGDMRPALELANHYRNQNNLAEMNALLERLAAAKTTFPDAPLNIGNFFAEKREFDQALAYYKRGLDAANETQRPKYLQQTVLVYRAQGRTADAERVLDGMIKSNPKDDVALNLRAVTWLESGDPQKISDAVKDLEGIVNRNPEDANYRYNYARALTTAGQLESALAQFNETLRLQPGYLLARINLAEIELQRGQFLEAQRQAEEVMALDPGNVRGSLLRAAALTSLRGYPEAREELNRLLRSQPNLVEAELQLGLLEIAQGRYAEADRIFRKHYQAGKSDMRALEGLVRSSFSQDQLDRAARLLSDELERSPKTGQLRVVLGQVYWRQNKFDQALEQYRQAAELAPRDSNIQMSIGQLLIAKNDASGALEAYQKSLQLDPTNAQANAYSAHLLAAVGRQTEAIDRYRKALAKMPENPEILNNLAYALADSDKDLDEALNLAQRALAKLPASDGVQDTVGWVYLKQGATDSAIQVFSKLAREKASNPTYHLHLGMALLRKGDKEGSRRALADALANQPSPTEKTEIERLLGQLKV